MIIFKPLENSDIEIIVQMQREFYAIDHYPIDIEVSKKLFVEFIENENLGKAWLIFSDNEIVGYVILTFLFSFEYRGKVAFLDELYLSEKARGKGIGAQSIDFIQSTALKLSLKLIWLEVEKHNSTAQKLYLAADFAVHNRILMQYKIK